MFLRDFARIVRFDGPPVYLATFQCASRKLELEVASPREAARLDRFIRTALQEILHDPRARTDAINQMLRDAAGSAALG